MEDIESNLKRAFRNQGNYEARSSDSLVPVVTFRYKSCEQKSRLKDYSLLRQAKGPQEEIASGMDQLEREEENTERALTWKSTITVGYYPCGRSTLTRLMCVTLRSGKGKHVWCSSLTSDSILRQRAPLLGRHKLNHIHGMFCESRGNLIFKLCDIFCCDCPLLCTTEQKVYK